LREITLIIKILVLVDHATGISGPHRNVVGSLNALSSRPDVDIRLLTGKIDENEPYVKRCDIHLEYEPHNISKLIKNQNLVRRAAKDRDIIYVPTGLKSFLYAFFAKGNCKLIAGPNVTPLPIPRRDDHPGKLEMVYMADHWLEASNFRKVHIEKSTGLKATVVQHAIDTEKFNPKHRDESIWDEYGIPKNHIKILYVGHDKTLRKGVENLIAAIELISKNTDIAQNLAFVFAGNISVKNLHRIQSLSNTYPLGFLYSDRLPVVMASADISVVPSSWENFPFSVMEAMSSGLPIIAGRVGGIPEQIGDSEGGILLEIGNSGHHTPKASSLLADAIMSLANNPKKRQDLGQIARQRVLTHFAEERLGQDLVDIFATHVRKI